MEISGQKVSFTDLWGLIVEYFLQQKVKEFMFECLLLFLFQVGALPTHVFRVKQTKYSPPLWAVLVQAVLWNKHSIFSKEFLIHMYQCYRKMQSLFGKTLLN